jgi:peptidoglycan/LPS O-acetylase OafA/YrhL
VFCYLREHFDYLVRPNRFLNVDVLRACAVLLVLIHHNATVIPSIAQGAFGDFYRFGAHGVDLFFVISGFLFGSMLLGELQKTNTIDLKRFYRHRFLRIVPLYWFSTIVSIPLCFWVGWCSSSSLPIVPKQFVLDLAFLHTLKGSATALQAWASWSLAIEIWFYLLIPITLIWIHRLTRGNEKTLIGMLGLLALAGLFVRGVCVYMAGSPLTDRMIWLATSRPYVRFDELLIGVLAFVLGRNLTPSRCKTILWIGGIVLMAAYLFTPRPLCSDPSTLIANWLFLPTVLAIGFACILVGSLASKFHHPVVTFIANLSYSLYLMHAMVTLVVSRQTHDAAFSIIFVVASLVAAYLVSALVEYPFLKMYKKPVQSSQPRIPRVFEPIELTPAKLAIGGSPGQV